MSTPMRTPCGDSSVPAISVTEVEPISVVIPTYGRPGALIQCLRGIAGQIPAPGEVICVVRDDDSDTLEALSEWGLSLPVRIVSPPGPGLVAALETGIASARCPLVAMVDDDAVPRPGWLELIQTHFASDPRIAGVGGRDWVHVDGVLDERHGRPTLRERLLRRPPKVGILEWTGRITDSHHTGTGPARDVDVLKGANMAFRRRALLEVGFDPRLRGTGTRHMELWPCLALRHRGRRIVYDPEVSVDHYVRPRPVGDERWSRTSAAIGDATFNETRAVLAYRRAAGRMLTVFWGLLIGTSSSPGLAQAIRLAAHRTPQIGLKAATGARVAAYRTTRADSRNRRGEARVVLGDGCRGAGTGG